MQRLLPALALIATCLPVPALADNEAQPGLWEYQMEMKMPGMPAGIPPTVMRRCLTPQDVAQNKHLISEQKKDNPCTVSNMKASGGRVSYDFNCKTEQGVMKGSASGAASATSFDMETRMQMVPPVPGMSEMQQRTRGRRIGNC